MREGLQEAKAQRGGLQPEVASDGRLLLAHAIAEKFTSLPKQNELLQTHAAVLCHKQDLRAGHFLTDAASSNWKGLSLSEDVLPELKPTSEVLSLCQDDLRLLMPSEILRVKGYAAISLSMLSPFKQRAATAQVPWLPAACAIMVLYTSAASRARPSIGSPALARAGQRWRDGAYRAEAVFGRPSMQRFRNKPCPRKRDEVCSVGPRRSAQPILGACAFSSVCACGFPICSIFAEALFIAAMAKRGNEAVGSQTPTPKKGKVAVANGQQQHPDLATHPSVRAMEAAQERLEKAMQERDCHWPCHCLERCG